MVTVDHASREIYIAIIIISRTHYDSIDVASKNNRV